MRKTVRKTMRRKHGPHRRGVMLMEMTAAALILVAAGALLVQMLFLAARQERAAEARQVAWRVAANRLEILAAKNFTELPAGQPRTEPVPEDLRILLPTAELRTQVTSHENDFVREVRVDVVWKSQAGVAVEPVSLAVWKHRPMTEVEP